MRGRRGERVNVRREGERERERGGGENQRHLAYNQMKGVETRRENPGEYGR